MSDTEAVIARLIDLLDRSQGVQGVYIDESECKVTAGHLRTLLALAKRPEPSEAMRSAVIARIKAHALTVGVGTSDAFAVPLADDILLTIAATSERMKG